MPKPARKRRSPRKKAVNRQQSEQQLTRYTRLLDAWVAKMLIAAKRVAQYRANPTYWDSLR